MPKTGISFRTQRAINDLDTDYGHLKPKDDAGEVVATPEKGMLGVKFEKMHTASEKEKQRKQLADILKKRAKEDAAERK